MIGNLDHPKVRPYDPPTTVQKIWTGQTVGFVTVLAVYASGKEGTYWLCRCRCGRFTIKSDRALGRKRQRSCGCSTLQATSTKNLTHGETAGRREPREMRSYSNARQRCTNSNNKDFPSYGGRGIEFRFVSYSDFLDCVGRCPTKDHTLERIDVNGHYEPGNVKWATRIEQLNNLRNTVWLTANGRTHTLTEWSELTGISRHTLAGRVHQLGWCDVCVVTLPTKQARGGVARCRCLRNTEAKK